MPTLTTETRTPDPALVNSISGRVTIPVLQTLVTGLTAAAGLASLTWGFLDESAWLVAGLVGFGVGAGLAWAFLWWDGRALLYVTTTTTGPEVAEQSPAIQEREPIQFRDWQQMTKPPAEAPDKMGRFLRDCGSEPSQRTLKRKGWSETEIASYRDRLIEQKRGAWKNPDDHKSGWKLL